MKKITRKKWAAFLVLVGAFVLLTFGLIFAIAHKGIYSAEAAAWFQAGASVGAILAAIWVMDAQHRRAVNQKLVDRVELQMNLAVALTNSAHRLVDVLDEVATLTKEDRLSKAASSYCNSQLAQVRETIERVPVIGMHTDDVRHAGRLSIACGKVISYAAMAKVEIRRDAEILHTEAEEQLAEVRSVLTDMEALRDLQQIRLDSLVG